VESPPPPSSADTLSEPGYPKLEKVSSLPYLPRIHLERYGAKVVEVAPGVWTAYAPGTSLQDYTHVGIIGDVEGYCSSIKKFEAKYSITLGYGCF
jgi:hypothetical protein